MRIIIFNGNISGENSGKLSTASRAP